MAEALVDTDVFVDHLRGARELHSAAGAVAYSIVTRCELFAARHVEEDGLNLLLAPFREIGIDRTIAEAAGRLRRDTGIRTPDAVIAATALEHRLVLVTRSRRGFQPVRGLRVRATLPA